MKYLLRRIRQRVFSNKDVIVQRKSPRFDFAKTRRGILRELLISQESGTLIGLISTSLGEGMFFVLILDIEREKSEELITFQTYSISEGRMLSTRKLRVSEIAGVCTFIQNTDLRYSEATTSTLAHQVP